jgi:hypothetical protein
MMVSDKNTSDEYLLKLRQHTRESIAFFFNQNKPERERCVVRAFLRCLGVPFTEQDLLVDQPEPVDVAALGARFQITEVLAKGRRRQQEYEGRLDELNQLTCDEELWEPWENPHTVSWREVIELVAERLSHKTAHADIDALVYINLGQTFLDPKSEAPNFSKVAALGWRSVSAVYLPYALVMYATEIAPAFLRKAVRSACNVWPNPEGWFEA